PFVLVLNHQTSLDIMAMTEILPRRCVPIAKKEILYMGTFGLACWFTGVIFIDRKRREESIGTLTEVAHSLHKDNV
ncbi:PLCA acyltransferase, partial [Orthonyx spaldingii]|nr:PLCA acyltransferase [Orthonyx spaldingii]